jgi:hypothetical protein
MGLVSSLVTIVLVGLMIGNFGAGITDFLTGLAFPDSLPVVGGAPLLPWLVTVNLVVTPILAFEYATGVDLLVDGDSKHQLRDDAFGSLVLSGLGLIGLGLQVNFELSSLVKLVALTLGPLFIGLFVVQVALQQVSS